jgi:hypothetical protein
VIQIPRSLVRQLRAVFRRSASKTSFPPVVSFHAGDDGRRIRLHHGTALAGFSQPGQWPVETLALPATALADFEGRTDAVVTLERHGSSILARWDDGSLPREMEYEGKDAAALPAFPDLPGNLVSNEPGFLKALADASQCTAREAIRYAVNQIQLRGKSGQVVATDGRQLLVQSGFQFPWEEDLLVPVLPVFGCREIPQEAPVALGNADDHVVFQVGPWSFFLPIAKEGRFPRTEDVIPSERTFSARWSIDPADGVFLHKALQRLPVPSDDDNQGVTIDLNGQAILRARASGQSRATELVAAKSSIEGKPVRLHINRTFLGRAFQLGFREVLISTADAPILCRDERRKYVVMPLASKMAIPPSADALRVASSNETHSTQVSTPTPQRRTVNMSTTETNGASTPTQTNGAQSNGSNLGSLIAEAEALRTMLHDAYLRSGKLLLTIKRQRKQAHIVQSTLAALKGLQHVGS